MQVRDALLARGQVYASEVDRYLELTLSGDVDLATAPLVSVWGRKPLS